MGKKMTTPGRKELICVLRERYALSSREEKSRILDEFTLTSRYHRKSAIRIRRSGSRKKSARGLGS